MGIWDAIGWIGPVAEGYFGRKKEQNERQQWEARFHADRAQQFLSAFMNIDKDKYPEVAQTALDQFHQSMNDAAKATTVKHDLWEMISGALLPGRGGQKKDGKQAPSSQGTPPHPPTDTGGGGGGGGVGGGSSSEGTPPTLGQMTIGAPPSSPEGVASQALVPRDAAYRAAPQGSIMRRWQDTQQAIQNVNTAKTDLNAAVASSGLPTGGLNVNLPLPGISGGPPPMNLRFGGPPPEIRTQAQRAKQLEGPLAKLEAAVTDAQRAGVSAEDLKDARADIKYWRDIQGQTMASFPLEGGYSTLVGSSEQEKFTGMMSGIQLQRDIAELNQLGALRDIEVAGGTPMSREKKARYDALLLKVPSERGGAKPSSYGQGFYDPREPGRLVAGSGRAISVSQPVRGSDLLARAQTIGQLDIGGVPIGQLVNPNGLYRVTLDGMTNQFASATPITPLATLPTVTEGQRYLQQPDGSYLVVGTTTTRYKGGGLPAGHGTGVAVGGGGLGSGLQAAATQAGTDDIRNRNAFIAKPGMTFSGKVSPAVKFFEPAMQADTRLRLMISNRDHPTAQGDISILFNHIGMTLGFQRGARQTETQIAHAITARSIPQDILAKIESWGLVPDKVYEFLGADPSQLPAGGFLSPEQRANMVDLAVEMREEMWLQARQRNKMAGITTEATPRTDLPPLKRSAPLGGTVNQPAVEIDPATGREMRRVKVNGVDHIYLKNPNYPKDPNAKEWQLKSP
jgi:hypothetical protein